MRHWLNRLRPEGLRQLLAIQRAAAETAEALDSLRAAEQRMEAILAQGQCFSRENLAVDGRDIVAAGIEPGPEVGRILDLVLEQVLDGVLPNCREALLDYVKSVVTLQ